MTDLKPCPFCGSEGEEVALHGPEVGADSYRGWNVQCYGCNVETAHEDDRAQAVTAWNTRAALSPPQVDRDSLGSGSSSATTETNPDGLTETLHSAGQWWPIETFRYEPGDPRPRVLIMQGGQACVARYVPNISSRSPAYWSTIPAGWPRYAPTHWAPLPTLALSSGSPPSPSEAKPSASAKAPDEPNREAQGDETTSDGSGA